MENVKGRSFGINICFDSRFYVFNIIGVEVQGKIPLKSRTTIVVDDKVTVEGGNGIIEKGKILLPVSIMKDNIFEKIIIDETDDKIHIEVDDPTFRLEDGSLNNRIRIG